MERHFAIFIIILGVGGMAAASVIMTMILDNDGPLSYLLPFTTVLVVSVLAIIYLKNR